MWFQNNESMQAGLGTWVNELDQIMWMDTLSTWATGLIVSRPS